MLRNKLFISTRLLNKLKMNGKILINGTSVYSSALVHGNDKITVNIDFEESDYLEAENIPLQIIFEDEYFLAVNKESGMCVHPSSYHPSGTLANGVKYYLHNNKKVRPINRLDKDTSGIVLFAKNEYIQERMIQNPTMQKEYLALCEGNISSINGTIDAPIARKMGSIMEREISEEGQRAVTHYEVLNYDKEKDISLVKLILETGRTHQIRVHLAYIGHPILGDTLYGKESKWISRQALHAWRLSFEHPISHKLIQLTTPSLFPKYLT